MSENGKGDTPRPIVVNRETFEHNWEQTFKRPEPEVVDPPIS